MKDKDNITLAKLSDEFEKSAKEIEVPDSLLPENMMAKFKEIGKEMESESKIADAFDKSEKKTNIILMRRMLAVAASFVLIAVIAAFLRNNAGTNTIGLKSAFEGFRNDYLIKGISSNDELENIVNEIFSSDKGSKNNKEESSTEKNKIAALFSGDEKSSEESSAPAVSVEDARNQDTDSMVCQAINSGDADRLSDTVKSSGDYLYILTKTNNTEAIKVVKVNPANEMEAVNSIPLSSSSANIVNDCLEIYMSGNHLIALIQRSIFVMQNDEMAEIKEVVAEYYDVTDPASIKKVCTQEQEGVYVTSRIAGGRFYLVTCKALAKGRGAVPYITLNGKDYGPQLGSEEYITATNAKEKAVMFMTAVNLDNPTQNPAKLAILGCGTNADVEISSGNVYIVRLFASEDGNEKRTEIYSFGCGANGFIKSGTYTFNGSIIGTPGINDAGYIRLIISQDGKYDAIALTSKLEKAGESKAFAAEDNSNVTFIGDKAFVTSKGKSVMVDFSEQGNITAKAINDITSSSSLYTLTDGNILAISTPDSEGKVNISLVTKSNGVASTYTLDGAQSVVITADSRAIVQSKEGNMFGLPVIIMDSEGTQRSAYCVFTTANGKIEPIGVFTHESNYVGDAATRAVYQNSTLYTVSNEKITAFSIEDNSITGALTLN